MSDQCEEQEMEAEALAAIFDDCLEVVSDAQPFVWSISIWPEQHSEEEENHVGVKLIANIPLDYPESSFPNFDLEVLKGLTDEHKTELLAMAKEEAEANEGLPSIFAVCEKLREWLIDNNQKGMDDVSMYAQMMRREKEKERQEQKAQQAFEAQKERTELTEAEAEELAVRKRRAEGTPVTKESFASWKEKFEQEMEEEKIQAALAAQEGSAGQKKGKNKEKVVDKSGRITGFKQFEDKSFNFEAMELACEDAQRDEEEDDDDEDGVDSDDGEDEGDNVVDEDLFDVDDDDLDDLDFDDDDDDEDDEPDI